MNRQDIIRDVAIREIGCLATWLRFKEFSPCEKHHLLTTGRHGTGKRRGEQATIGLSTYYHRGYNYSGLQPKFTRAEAFDYFGPSYADNARLFRQVFGDDEFLLAEQNRLIAIWRESIVGAVA